MEGEAQGRYAPRVTALFAVGPPGHVDTSSVYCGS